MTDEKYNLRGVSASKEDVHNAIKNIDKGLYPKAFCKIIPDFLGNDPEYCNIMHADGAGTKSALAYVYWRETGDLSVWKGIAQDALIMAEITSPGIRFLFRPMVDESRILSVAPTQIKSSIFIISASCAIPFHTVRSPVSRQ